jgi:hypothetical protein
MPPDTAFELDQGQPANHNQFLLRYENRRWPQVSWMQIVNSPRIRLSAAALIAVFSLTSRVALTQPFPLPTPAPAFPFPGVPPGDADRIQAAAARLREGRSIGTVERWRNPDTKDAGEVELLRRFDHDGMPCRTIRYTIRYKSQPDRLNRSVVNWCRVLDGTWKIVEIPQ